MAMSCGYGGHQENQRKRVGGEEMTSLYLKF